ncbi:MAG: transglutaminase [Cycloclasticus sp. symbiont of Bathymodiolus heckerae]|nr:MAG: transglutaminase [Cycloclasticus sp. symbiont of Bathymodiolus heckerae]
MEASTIKSQPLQPVLVYLLVAIGMLLIAPHIGELNPSFIAIGISLLIWRALTVKLPTLLPVKFILLPLSIGLTFFVFKTFGMSLGRDASSSLLIVLIGLKLLESKTARDAQAVIYMCFFMLITPFLFDQRIELAIYGLIIFFMLLFALVLNNTHTASFKNPPLLRLSGFILLQSIPLMLLFFVLFPRMIGPLWAMPNQQSAISGISDTISPGSVSNLALSDETAFRVRFHGKPPEQKQLYWRGPVFWDTDGFAWTHVLPTPVNNDTKPTTVPDTSYQYTLMMEPHQQRWLYGLDTPISAPRNVQITNDQQLILKNKLDRNLSFDITSSNNHPRLELSKNAKERALQLPKNIDSRVTALATQWKNTNPDPSDIIRQALSFYNAEFYYTLNPPSLSKNPVAEFLFDTKRGFCGHFATSFATLMRAADIPARLVGGYQGGIYNSVGDFYTIRQADAHVWVEVWLEEGGWTRVDPTAAIAPNRIEHSIDVSQQQLNRNITFLLSPSEGLEKWAQHVKWMVNSIDYYWQSAVLAYGPEKQLEFLSNFGIIDWSDMILWLSILSGVFVLAAVSTLFIPHQNKDPVQKGYLRLCRKLSKITEEKKPYETTSDYIDRVITAKPTLTSELNIIKTLYLKTRYGSDNQQAFLKAIKQLHISNTPAFFYTRTIHR